MRHESTRFHFARIGKLGNRGELPKLEAFCAARKARHIGYAK